MGILMLNPKICRLVFHTTVLLYLGATLYQVKGNPQYSRVDSLASDLGKLEATIDSLNLQQRLTSIEEQIKHNRTETDKNSAWQDRFQWALILLLGESIVRLYDQFRTKDGK
jgi:hypothetical protein